MNIFTKQLRMVLVLAVVAAAAAWWVGCGGDSGTNSSGDGSGANSGGGGNVVGDWLKYSQTIGGTTTLYSGTGLGLVESYESSGELTLRQFEKYTDGTYREVNTCPGCTWRTEGSLLIWIQANGTRVGTYYSVSGNTLTRWIKAAEKDTALVTMVFTKINLADYRRSLGL